MDTSEEYTFAELLKQFRARERMSQQQLADHLKEFRPKMHRNTISAWECGEYLPDTLEMVQHVADVLQLDEKDTDSLLNTVREKITLKYLWNVPFERNPFFTGREDTLVHLHDTLTPGRTVALTQAISGLGGIGKTQTAVEYVYRYRKKYQTILWVQADSRERLLSSLVSIADMLNLAEKNEQDQNRIVGAVVRWLNVHKHWLLILDNIEELKFVEEFIPPGHQGSVLLTTRAHVTEPIAQASELEKMEEDEGALLLLRRAKIIALDASLAHASKVDLMKAREISRIMDGLPLAIDQAGAYILETQCGVSGYLDLYQQRSATELLKKRGEFVSGHPASVTTTFLLSFEKVERANHAAIELLRLCAFLHPDAIPEEIITDGAPHLGRHLQPVAADPFTLNEAIKALLTYSLVRRNAKEKTLTIHRLVQAVLKDKMDKKTYLRWAKRTVQAVTAAFPLVEFMTWSRCERCLPHAQMCAALIKEGNMTSLDAARLLNRAGSYLTVRARYVEAELLAEQALAIRERLGAEDLGMAESLDDLAIIYTEQGKYAEAQPLFQRALQIREQVRGHSHLDVARSMNNLANLYRVQGKYAEAESLLERALAIKENVLGPWDPSVAGSLNNLADCYREQRKFEEAEPLLQRALQMLEQARGVEHPDTANSMDHLAAVYASQGKYAEAESLFQRALQIQERVRGSEHPDTALTLSNIALCYYEQGKYAEAEPLLQRALQMLERILGPQHSLTVSIQRDYTHLLEEMRRQK